MHSQQDSLYQTPVTHQLLSLASLDVDTSVHSGLRLLSKSYGTDIGTGAPWWLLRDAELTQVKLHLFCRNRNDTYFRLRRLCICAALDWDYPSNVIVLSSWLWHLVRRPHLWW
ncbi:hypothetical protein BDW72DRAFT_132581 [Aspergillus terricola var. indicus]